MWMAAALLCAASLWLQSCSTAKGCGCGSNINQVYKSPKRYH